MGTTFIESDRLLQRSLSALKLADDPLKLGERLLERKTVNVLDFSHGNPRNSALKLVIRAATCNGAGPAGFRDLACSCMARS
jgi:hypothetical protein